MGIEEKVENGDLYPKIVFQPEMKENELSRFTKFVEEKYNIKLNDYWDLHEWSRVNYPEFWECLWQFYDIVCSQSYTEVYDRKRSLEDMEWFKGVKFNFAENVLRFRDSRTALITADASDNNEYITYEQLYNEVAVYADALKAFGVKKGDIVTCFMSNKVEAVYAYLATSSIGALWSGALPLLGAKSVLARFEQMNPKILFTAGNFSFDGKEIDMIHKIKDIAKNLTSLEKVVFVPSKLKSNEMPNIPKCVSIEDFLAPSRKKFQKSGFSLHFEQVPFDYPLCVNFTSGTTGAPKSIIHSHGSILAPLRDYGLYWSLTKEDVIINFSPVGWVSWNMHVSTLSLGLTLVMYDGLPFEESPTRFWDIMDKFGVSASFIWSSAAESMEVNGYLPTKHHSLKSLKELFPMGSPCKPQSFEFLTKKIKPGLFVASCYGTTEFFGMCSGISSNLPVYKGEIQCPSLGLDLRTVDEKGNFIVGERGDMVELNPCPTLPVSCLGDDPKKKIKEMYLSKYPGMWYIGDDAWFNPVTRGFIVYGRSDETMNPKGARFNCAEIYFALEGFPGIVDSVCVSHFNSRLDERVVLFVNMAPGHSLTPQVEAEIRRTIEEDLSYEHVPELIIEVPGVPYNLNGKKLNSLVKKLINKKPVSNTDIVINPQTVDFFKNVELGDF